MIKYFVALQAVLGAGNNRVVGILNHFGNPENVFLEDEKIRAESGLFSKLELKKIKSFDFKTAEKTVDLCHKNGIDIIPLGDERYPYCLSVIDNPPLVIYVKGKLPDFDEIPTICIVGPRNVSDFGKKAAFSLSYRLARSGMIIVSGGALGTDTYAHTGALKADGINVLCMGCGILSDYLPENKKLRQTVLQNGCLISEYPPEYPANKYTFPVRNRIMSALSLGTVVIEAGEKSGSLITARHSYEQGRDVFVIPGSPDKKEYVGSNALLRDGAKPLLDASDIFNEYIPRFPDKINIERAFSKPALSDNLNKKKEKIEENQKNLNETLSKEAKIVYNCIDKQKFLPDELINTGLTSAQMLSALTELEMELLIRALPGGMYEKCI